MLPKKVKFAILMKLIFYKQNGILLGYLGYMIKKIEIAGIELDNCTVRESIMLLEKAKAEQSFFSIQEVNMDTILRAASDVKLKDAITKLSHTIISEDTILKAAKENSIQRQYEISDRTFFYELMKRIERNHISICLLGQTEALVMQQKAYIMEQFPRIEIVDVEILENCTGETDKIINEINAKTPDVVISILPTPMQEHFFADYRDKLSAGLWYGMEPVNVSERKSKISSFFRGRIRLRALLKHIMKYEEQEAVKNE